MSDKLAQTLYELPKAELHVHLEGTVRPETLRELCSRHDVEPDAPVLLADGKKLYPPVGCGHSLPELRGFQDFIRYYLKISDLLRTADDLAFAAQSYIEQCVSENIKYVECYFSPTTYAFLGREPEKLFAGLIEAESSAAARGVELKWIFDIVRNTSRDGMDALELAERARRVGVSVAAIGLAGDEKMGEPKQFVKAFEEARRLGYKTLAHSGEGTNSDKMMELQDCLKPQRIGHALSALDSRELSSRLKSEHVVIESCPWSNVALGFTSEELHPIAEMFTAGLPVVICSDDPGIFGKSLTDNYLFAAARGVSLEDLSASAELSLKCGES